MDVISAKTAYAVGLLFATEVAEAATRPEHGHHGDERLRDPYAKELLSCQGSWSWCDNAQDVDLVAGLGLRATVDYVVRRSALSLPRLSGQPHLLWPDLEVRLASLAQALEFAASCAEEAWSHQLDVVLAPWLRQRLVLLLGAPTRTESMGAFEARVRRAVTVTHRYRLVRYELFGDRHWVGRPEAPWWCPDVDLAARSPFACATGEVPMYVVRLDETGDPHGTGELTVVTGYRHPPRTYRFTLDDGVANLPAEADSTCRELAQAGLAALGVCPASK